MNRLTKKNTFYYENSQSVNDKKICSNALNKLGKIEDLMEKYDINDLVELEIALDYYKHRYDNVQTRRVDR